MAEPRAAPRPAVAVEAPPRALRPEAVPASREVPEAPPSWGNAILWYVPNRVLDLLDIFRLRIRVGPGLAANFRITDYGAFYIGNYNSVYVGLPGPRSPHSLAIRPWAGNP